MIIQNTVLCSTALFRVSEQLKKTNQIKNCSSGRLELYAWNCLTCNSHQCFLKNSMHNIPKRFTPKQHIKQIIVI